MASYPGASGNFAATAELACATGLIDRLSFVSYRKPPRIMPVRQPAFDLSPTHDAAPYDCLGPSKKTSNLREESPHFF